MWMDTHHYPGLGLDLRHEYDGFDVERFPMGSHYVCRGSLSEILLVREVAMMIIMNQLTEKPDWHVKVFDDTITEKWIQEALAIPVDSLYNEIVHKAGDPWGPKRLKTILDRDCMKFCIEELRSKAQFFEKTNLVPTLDASASVVKSDNSIDESLHSELRAAFDKLLLEQKDDPDWHPGSNDMVQDLVHPSLYPLVYGRSRVMRQERVGVEDAIDKWSGKGEVIPKPENPSPLTHRYRSSDSNLWSENYQWLPSNVSFQDDGSVKFTSYINGLHPIKHRDIYKTIEKLIEKALPAWDFCLPYARRNVVVSACRTKPRFGYPKNPDDDNEENWYIKVSDVPKRDAADDDSSGYDDDDSDAEEERQRRDWQKLREPVQPKPPTFKAWNYGTKPGGSFREKFQGIQVIVKMASIELTPEKPTFPAGGWHVEGQVNEHIIGTALYYLDSENVAPSSLKFRMSTSSQPSELEDRVGQDNYSWCEQVYGTRLRDAECFQQYGSVETKEKRLLAFPNVFHHRVSPFELKDKTKPGHRRFIALWLVDPHTRIINTGNVPPQQHSWWAERAFGSLEDSDKIPQPIAKLVSEAAPDHASIQAAVEKGQPLPAELMEMVKKQAAQSDTPMTLTEAKEHRLKLMEERTRIQHETEQGWVEETYGFCEH